MLNHNIDKDYVKSLLLGAAGVAAVWLIRNAEWNKIVDPKIIKSIKTAFDATTEGMEQMQNSFTPETHKRGGSRHSRMM